MGLFDNEESYEDLTKGGSGGTNKYLAPCVILAPVLDIRVVDGKTGNRAIALDVDTGFRSKEDEPIIRSKTYWMLDKYSTKGADGFFTKFRQGALSDIRKMLITICGIRFEDLSSIEALEDVAKLPGLVSRMKGQGKTNPFGEKTTGLVGKELAWTIDYDKDPNKETGKYNLAVQWINKAEDFDYREGAFKPVHGTNAKGYPVNPNPKDDAAGGVAKDAEMQQAEKDAQKAFPTMGADSEPDDLPF